MFDPTAVRVGYLVGKANLGQVLLRVPRQMSVRVTSSLFCFHRCVSIIDVIYRGTDKSLARPGRKQVTATGDFDVHISYF